MSDTQRRHDPVDLARRFTQRFHWVPLTPDVRDDMIAWFTNTLNEPNNKEVPTQP